MELRLERLGPTTIEMTFHDAHRALSWSEVARALVEDEPARQSLAAAIAEHSAEALFWECAPASRRTAGEPFDCVLIDAPSLARRALDSTTFRRELEGADSVASFRNLGADAQLIVPAPRPGVEPATYAHLAAFVRDAPRRQVHDLFARVGRETLHWWSQRAEPVWVSTSGLGVTWLHVRLDERPKYYQHAPFRRWAPER